MCPRQNWLKHQIWAWCWWISFLYHPSTCLSICLAVGKIEIDLAGDVPASFSSEKTVSCPPSWVLDLNSSVLDGPSYNLHLTHDKCSETQIARAKYRHLGIWKKWERSRHVLVALKQMLIKETETWWLPLLEDCRNQAQASKKVQKFGKEGEIDDMWHDRIFSKCKTWKSSNPHEAVFSFLSVYTVDYMISSFVLHK